MTRERSDAGRDDLPPIYVSDDGYDDMGAILDDLGIEYEPLSDVDLDTRSNGVAMLNCKMGWRLDSIHPSYRSLRSSFESFVAAGGSGIVSDFAGSALQTFTDAGFDRSTDATDLTATVEDAELIDLLGTQQIELTFDMGGWYKPTTLPDGSEPLLRAADSSTVLAYKFDHGEGSVVYTAFHNHAQISDVERALLHLLVVIPIAESNETTVTDTYETVTGMDAGSETVIDRTTRIRTPDEIDAPTTDETVTPSTLVRLNVLDGGSGAIERSIPRSGSVPVGRGDFAGTVPDDTRRLISERHFELRQTDPRSSQPGLLLTDLDSTNGTTINGQDVSNGEPWQLPNGSHVTLANGAVRLQVEY